MRIGSRLTALRFRPRLLRRTIRTRLALFYWGLFFVAAVVLLILTIALSQSTSIGTAKVHPPAHGARPTAISPSHPTVGVTRHSSGLRHLLFASALALGIMAVPALLLGWLAAGRFLRPLRMITATTREISATNLDQRLNRGGPDDELKELADTFDELLDRLERSFAFERQFVATAAHELRTPLAGMRTSLDVAMAKPGSVPPHIRTLADRLRRELDHVDRLLESFLTLAHTQQGPVADQSTVSLADIARLALERRTGAISAMGLDVEQQQRPDVWVAGGETLLSRMVENVIDNAIGHNQPGGWVRVTTTVEGQLARLVVENGGPALDPDDVKELTRPFRRIGAQRTGSDKGAGLGLAIVSSIVEVQGGTLDLQARGDGGLRVVITLPLAIRTAAGAPA